MNLVSKILTFGEGKKLKRYEALVGKINDLEPAMQALSDEELKALTVRFKERHAAGESLDALLPEAFAAVREASFRTLGMRHFDVQLIGGMALHAGQIAEMLTGEGKTLVAALAVGSVSGKVAYVVVGDEGSAAYAYGNYGTKVKKAMELQDAGRPIQIIREQELFR